MVCSLQLKNF
jgi:hypothetical protein